jgi:hypothetical protein
MKHSSRGARIDLCERVTVLQIDYSTLDLPHESCYGERQGSKFQEFPTERDKLHKGFSKLGFSNVLN